MAYLVQSISYGKPVGRLEREDWGKVLPMLTIIHCDFAHLPKYLEAHVSQARYCIRTNV